jgi:hypothetical protein
MTQIESIDEEPEQEVDREEAHAEMPKVRRRRKYTRHAQEPAAQVQAPAKQAATEQRFTAEYWEKQLREEAETAAQQAPEPEPQTMTREQYLAQAKKQNPTTVARTVARPRSSGFIDRLQANVDEALGAAHPGIAHSPSNYTQPRVAMPQPRAQSAAEAPLEELAPSGGGIFSSISSNPVMSGILAFVGLLIALFGTYISKSVVGFGAEMIGFVIFIAGMIFIFKYTRQMKRLQAGA